MTSADSSPSVSAAGFLDERRARFAVFALAVSVVLAFALFTDHRWEDYYITFRSSKNLANGHGLVYQVGERVHTFTSPLGVLLPALASAITGGQNDEAALWVFRTFCFVAFGGAALLLWSAAGAWGWSRFGPWFVVAALVTDAKSVDFSINGMETAFMLFLLAAVLHTFATGGRRAIWRLGAAWGGLMWTRPDSLVYIGALGLAALVFVREQRLAPSRRALLGAYLRAGLICTALYAPWLLFAWSYYGSPIPNTIIAKGFGHSHVDVGALLADFARMLYQAIWSGPLDHTFAPTYYVAGGWPQIVVWVGRALACVALFSFLLPGVRPEMRVSSLAFLIAAFYCRNIWLFPWYLPPAALLALFTIGGWTEIFRTIAAHRPWARVWPLPFVAVLIATTLTLAASAWEMRVQQRIVEGHRRRIGEWLAAHRTGPHDSVFLEPIGYIGFYSGLKVLDFPGLTAPELIAARQVVGSDWQTLIGVLAPTWVVARPGEPHTARTPGAPSPFTEHYELVATFDVSKEIDQVRFLPGRGYLRADQTFRVYRRRP